MKDVPESGDIIEAREGRSVKKPLSRAEKMLVGALEMAERLEGAGQGEVSGSMSEARGVPENWRAAP